VAVRSILTLPTLPARLEDDLEEIKQLIGDLLVTEDTLVRTTQATNEQTKALDTAVAQLAEAIAQLREINESLDRLDRRQEAMQADIRRIAHAVEDVAEHLPRKGEGPLARAKDALTGEA
jgi:chromosome segregation ATPase